SNGILPLSSSSSLLSDTASATDQPCVPELISDGAAVSGAGTGSGSSGTVSGMREPSTVCSTGGTGASIVGTAGTGGSSMAGVSTGGVAAGVVGVSPSISGVATLFSISPVGSTKSRMVLSILPLAAAFIVLRTSSSSLLRTISSS